MATQPYALKTVIWLKITPKNLCNYTLITRKKEVTPFVVIKQYNIGVRKQVKYCNNTLQKKKY
jgi:hypothetical protein